MKSVFIVKRPEHMLNQWFTEAMRFQVAGRQLVAKPSPPTLRAESPRATPKTDTA
jgi:hypothetical protein